MKLIHWLAMLLAIIGGLNWGAIGVAHVNLVTYFFGTMPMVVKTIYIGVGLSAIYLLANIKDLS